MNIEKETIFKIHTLIFRNKSCNNVKLMKNALNVDAYRLR